MMSMPAPKNAMRPVHPGEVLREDYLKPLGTSPNALAKALHVPASRINDIVLERRGVTVDTAMRLARYFGGDVQSWLNLQLAYDPAGSRHSGITPGVNSFSYSGSGFLAAGVTVDACIQSCATMHAWEVN
jgi:addiction module HigA family antidote